MESNEERTKRLTMLTEKALTLLRVEKSVPVGSPMKFTIKELVDATKKVDVEDKRGKKWEKRKKGIHRCNFSRSDNLRRLVASARGEADVLPAVPDFKDVAALRLSKENVSVRYGRRRAELRKYSHRRLAFLLAGLEELERHYQARQVQLEAQYSDLEGLKTTENYPAVPFQATPEGVKRYEQYATRTSVNVLVDLIVRREKALAVIRAHVDKYDRRYTDLMLAEYKERIKEKKAEYI